MYALEWAIASGTRGEMPSCLVRHQQTARIAVDLSRSIRFLYNTLFLEDADINAAHMRITALIYRQ